MTHASPWQEPNYATALISSHIAPLLLRKAFPARLPAPSLPPLSFGLYNHRTRKQTWPCGIPSTLYGTFTYAFSLKRHVHERVCVRVRARVYACPGAGAPMQNRTMAENNHGRQIAPMD